MNLVNFPQANRTYAKDQPEYRQLPAHAVEGPEGRIVFCWSLSWYERLVVLFTGKLWHSVLTFNQPLQPQLVVTKSPFEAQ